MTTFAVPAPQGAQLGVVATVTLEPHELPVGSLANTKIRALTDYLNWQMLASSTAFPSTGPTLPPLVERPEQYQRMMVSATTPGVVAIP